MSADSLNIVLRILLPFTGSCSWLSLTSCAVIGCLSSLSWHFALHGNISLWDKILQECLSPLLFERCPSLHTSLPGFDRLFALSWPASASFTNFSVCTAAAVHDSLLLTQERAAWYRALLQLPLAQVEAALATVFSGPRSSEVPLGTPREFQKPYPGP